MATNSNIFESTFKKPGKTKAFFICLLIASFLWVVHALNTVYTYNFSIPVEFKNLPADKKPLMQLPQVINADVKASGLKLGLMLLRQPFKSLSIDMNGLKTVNRGQHYVLSGSPIDFESIFHFETTIRHLSPDTLYFTDRTGFEKNIPIKVPMNISCREGFGFKKPTISPSFITIWGDSNVLQSVDTVYTQMLNLTQITNNVSENIPVIKPGSGIYTSLNQVHVQIDVDRLVEHQLTIPIKDIQQHPGKSINIFPAFARIKFTTLQGSFLPEDSLLFKVMVNSERRNHRTNKFPVILGTVPGHVTVIDYEPKEADILILSK